MLPRDATAVSEISRCEQCQCEHVTTLAENYTLVIRHAEGCVILLAFGNMFHMTLLMPMATLIPEWSIADRLRKARETTGLDQIEFAAHSGISRTSITNYEQGKRTPRGLYLRAWAEATGVDAHWIETGHAKTPADDTTGVCDLCALTGSNRGPADYGSGALEHSFPSVPEYVPAWMLAEVGTSSIRAEW